MQNQGPNSKDQKVISLLNPFQDKNQGPNSKDESNKPFKPFSRMTDRHRGL